MPSLMLYYDLILGDNVQGTFTNLKCIVLMHNSLQFGYFEAIAS